MSCSSFPVESESIASNRACERRVNGRFAAQRSSLFLWYALRSVPATRPPAPSSAPARAFSGMSAHRSAPDHPVFCPLRSISAPLSAHMRWVLMTFEVMECRRRIYVNSRYRQTSEMLDERTLSGRFSPLSAPRPPGPAPCSAPAQAFSGMSAHRSAPVHPIFCPLRSVFRSAHTLSSHALVVSSPCKIEL